jgi:putative ABC transport system permease protein
MNSLARIFEGAAMALDSLRANKVRAALTILGIAIGVTVVIAMASAITGINRSVAAELETLGPKTFFVMRYFQGGLNISDGSEETQPWRKMPEITVADAEVVRQLPAIRSVVYRESANGPVSYGNTRLESVNVIGFSPDWIFSVGGTMTAGRNYTQMEEAAGAFVAVASEELVEELFPGLDPIGRRIKVYGQPFTVMGVYRHSQGMFGGENPPTVVIPHSTFTKVADYWRGWMDLAVRPTETATLEEAQEQVIVALRAKRGLRPSQENNFAVVSQDKLMETFSKITGGFFLVMLVLSSVGLMVGGVGVIAIMMISVTERTREIGVRKALGATRREIMFQFLVEAATLTLVGAVVGLVLGGLASWGIRAVTPLPTAVPLWSVVAAIGASIVTGICFGLYPAGKASRLDPVEALRYE